MSGARRALFIANDAYADAGLHSLVAPSHDAQALAEALANPAIGNFDVHVLHNQTAHGMRVAIEELFVEGRPDDLLLLYFSCHGLKDLTGALYLAAADTAPRLLRATALGAEFVQRLIGESRARRIVLFLDCCYGGAFVHGMVVKAGGQVHVQDSFSELEHMGGARGCVIITASSSTQYAFENGLIQPGAAPQPSVFTGALLDGLTNPAVDRDGDGWIGLSELFLFVEDRVRTYSTYQTPQMWALGTQGDLLIARSPLPRIVPAPLPSSLTTALEDSNPLVRLGAVQELRRRLRGTDLAEALTAHDTLRRLSDDDSQRVSVAAADALTDATLVVTPAELDFGNCQPEELPATREFELLGIPLATSVAARSPASWVRIRREREVLYVTARPDRPGQYASVVALLGPQGEHRIPVRISVSRTPAHPEPTPPTPTPAERLPRVAEMGERFIARFVDWMILVIPLLILTPRNTGTATSTDSVSLAETLLIISFFLTIAAYEIVLTALWGQSLGKRLLRLKVVRLADAGAIGWGTSVLRWVVQFLAWVPGLIVGAVILYASPFWDSTGRRQGWHDKIAGTVVVKLPAKD